MNNRLKLLVIGLGVATVTVATLMIMLWPDLGRQRQANADLLARVTALESTQPAPVDSAVGEAPAPATIAEVPGSTTPGAPAARANVVPATPPRPAGEAQNPPIASMLQAMQTPAGQDFTRSMMRSMMSEMYPDIGTELDLSAEEVTKLFDLLAKQQVDLSAESMSMLTGSADPATMQATQRKLVEQQDAHERELTAMLGSKYAKWEEYQGTAAARQQVGQLRATLSASGNALSEAQEKSLVAAFAREQSRMTREERDWMSSSAALSSPNMMQESLKRALDGQRRLVDVAAPILDAAQLSQFRRQVDQQASMMGAMIGMMGGQGARP